MDDESLDARSSPATRRIGRPMKRRRSMTMPPSDADLNGDLGDLKLVDWRAVSKILSDHAARAQAEAARAPKPGVTWEAERLALYKRKLALEMEAIRLYEPTPHRRCGPPLRCPLERSSATAAARAGKIGLSMRHAEARLTPLLGCHPHGKYVKRNGLAWFVGLKEKHLILMYDSLFREGAFRVIRDEHTKLWRTIRPLGPEQ